MSEWLNVVRAAEIAEGEHQNFILKGRPIAIFNLNGNFYAIEDCCTHQALPLSEGHIENGVITCPYHGAKFDIKTGEVKAPPAFDNLPVFEVRIMEGILQIYFP